jgi:hypothetical protein
MSNLAPALEQLMMEFTKEGCDGDITLKVSDRLMDRFCLEIQKHQGKYVRHHDDGSIEKGQTISLKFNTSFGTVHILRNNF